MDAVAIETLLAAARTAGLTVRVEGARLRIRGPRQAEPLALALLARKAEVVAALQGAPVDAARPAACSGCGWPTHLGRCLGCCHHGPPTLAADGKLWWERPPWCGQITDNEFHVIVAAYIARCGYYEPTLPDRQPAVLQAYLAARTETARATAERTWDGQ